MHCLLKRMYSEFVSLKHFSLFVAAACSHRWCRDFIRGIAELLFEVGLRMSFHTILGIACLLGCGWQLEVEAAYRRTLEVLESQHAKGKGRVHQDRPPRCTRTTGGSRSHQRSRPLALKAPRQ